MAPCMLHCVLLAPKPENPKNPKLFRCQLMAHMFSKNVQTIPGEDQPAAVRAPYMGISQNWWVPWGVPELSILRVPYLGNYRTSSNRHEIEQGSPSSSTLNEETEAFHAKLGCANENHRRTQTQPKAAVMRYSKHCQNWRLGCRRGYYSIL